MSYFTISDIIDNEHLKELSLQVNKWGARFDEILFQFEADGFHVMEPFKPKGKKKKTFVSNITGSFKVDETLVDFFDQVTERIKEEAANKSLKWIDDSFAPPLNENDGNHYLKFKITPDTSFRDERGNEITSDEAQKCSGKMAMRIEKVYRFTDDDGVERVGYTVLLDYFKSTGPKEGGSKKRKFADPFA